MKTQLKIGTSGPGRVSIKNALECAITRAVAPGQHVTVLGVVTLENVASMYNNECVQLRVTHTDQLSQREFRKIAHGIGWEVAAWVGNTVTLCMRDYAHTFVVSVGRERTIARHQVLQELPL
jgi:hypothetical protein